MDFGLLDSYEPVVRKVASSLVRRGGIDVLANDQDDYESLLRIASFNLQNEFRDRYGFNLEAERRYVMKALWNEARTLGRTRIRRMGGMLRHEAEPEGPAHTLKAELEGRMEARYALRRLASRMGQEDFSVLRRVGESVKGSQAYDPALDQGSKFDFAKRVTLLRKQAREILDK